MHVDVHAHFIPPVILDWAEKESGFPVQITRDAGGQVDFHLRNGVFRRLSPDHWNLEVRLKDLDRMGVDVQLISISPFLCLEWLPPDEAADLVPAINDALIAACREHPDRLVPMCGLPLQHPEAAKRELRRCMEQYGVRAFQLPVVVAGRDLDTPEVESVLATAAAAGAFLFIHPLFLPDLARLNDFYNSNLIGNPLETHLCAARLIFSGVMDRLPDLRICLAHAGGSLPWGIARMDHGYAVRPETRRHAVHPPSHYLKRFFYDTVVHSQSHLAFLHQQVGSSQILLGTDHPFDMGIADPVAYLERAPLDAAARSAIAEGNARRLGLLDRVAPAAEK